MLGHRELHAAVEEQEQAYGKQRDGRPDIGRTDDSLIAKGEAPVRLTPADLVADQEEGRRQEAQRILDELGLQRLGTAHDHEQQCDG